VPKQLACTWLCACIPLAWYVRFTRYGG